MKPPFQKDRKLDLSTLQDWPRKAREDRSAAVEKTIDKCPYCSSKKIVKRGVRKKKLEEVQLYLCNDCSKSFTPQKVKGKTFPLKMIIDGMSSYNMGYTLEESCGFLKESYGMDVQTQTLSNWLDEFSKLCTYSRMREFGKKLYTPNQIIQSVTLFHRQVYRYRYHRAKAELCLQEFKNASLEPLKGFLEAIMAECPHQLFREGGRASDNIKFDLSQLIVNERFNFAVRLAQLVLQAVNNNRERHEILQKFMLANDSVTVAAEVPVYIDSDDVDHMRIALGFEIPDIFRSSADVEVAPAADRPDVHKNPGGDFVSTPGNDGSSAENNGDTLRASSASTPGARQIITGHIDFLQIRNGSVHILDYKPNAKKEMPVGQLTIYALALSRLTGLRMFDFKCAWFDDKNYYEFFPLHVVYKRNKMRVARGQVRLNQIEAGDKNRN
ncbi:MAG: hypothetical protein HY517_03275 [Candidatus Aenigmarchaeota archaeon]|nr:hypothetical protein [Candidatus Aenigmarchaeota archaeon]